MKYESNRNKIDQAMQKAAMDALEAVGLEAQRDLTLKITDNKQVDTGRLRASMTYVAGDRVGNIKADNKGILHNEDKPSGKLDYGTLHIGSNVHYAQKQEKAKPYLVPTVKSNISKYRNMIQDIYKKLVE